MDGLLKLPSLWVYVYFEDGTVENVANSDTLSLAEAMEYKMRWEKKGKISQITLETSDRKIVKRIKAKELD